MLSVHLMCKSWDLYDGLLYLLTCASSGVYWFFGGLLMVLASILEFILGNTFPFVVFGSFGAFWLTYGATLTPYFNAQEAYANPPPGGPAPSFAGSFGFFQLYMGVLCLVYLVCALRTNLVFVGIFATLVPAFGCLTGSFWQLEAGNAASALSLQHAAGGLTFVTCLLGWYLFFIQCLAAVDFPLNLPVGDLSVYIKGASEKAKTA